LLLIDTSGRTGRVGLALGPTLLDRAELDPGRGHARDLTRVIRDLLTRGGKTPANLAAIGLNIGPGSFTGIRVGLATAKAMAFALGVKIIGSDVFDLIAARFAAQHPALYVVVDFQLNSLLSVDFQIDGEGKVVRCSWRGRRNGFEPEYRNGP
jgi:tRNA threonylcarbamoyladenosine biosynthesis protein TsaB